VSVLLAVIFQPGFVSMVWHHALQSAVETFDCQQIAWQWHICDWKVDIPYFLKYELLFFQYFPSL